MMIRTFALNNSPCPRGKNHAIRIKPVVLGAILAVYAIIGLGSTVRAQGGGQCTMEPARRAALQQAAHGFFQAMRIGDKSYYAGALNFQDSQGKTVRLAQFHGKTLLVNLWAVWCAPCRQEMPELAELKRKLGGDAFDVLAINIDRSADEKARHFLEEAKAGNLVLYRDKTMEIFQSIKREGLALGLPATLLIDPEGCLLASLNGSAPWADGDAVAFIRAVLQSSR